VQTIEVIKAEILDMAEKIRAAQFELKKGTWACRYCDYKNLCD